MTRIKRPRALAALAVAAAVALLLIGCGALRESRTSASPSGSGSGSGSSSETSAAASAIPVGTSTRTVTVAGQTRSYLVHRPSALPAEAPLVMMLHGCFGTAAQAEKSYGWDAEAETQHFVAVYPDGENHAWNVGGGCCGAPGRGGVDDVGFLSAVVHDMESSMSIDASRIYATGISNGGMMAYRFACETGVLAAIGPDSGPPIPAVNQLWRTADDCDPPQSTTSGDLTTSIAPCPNGRTVELITVAGAGHQWPGSSEVRPGADPPYRGLDATAVLWNFFAAHPAPSA